MSEMTLIMQCYCYVDNCDIILLMLCCSIRMDSSGAWNERPASSFTTVNLAETLTQCELEVHTELLLRYCSINAVVIELEVFSLPFASYAKYIPLWSSFLLAYITSVLSLSGHTLHLTTQLFLHHLQFSFKFSTRYFDRWQSYVIVS